MNVFALIVLIIVAAIIIIPIIGVAIIKSRTKK